MPRTLCRLVMCRAALACAALVAASAIARAQDSPPPPPPPPPTQAEPVKLEESSESPHTGFKALFRDTIGDFKHFATDKEPLLWMAGGGVTALAFHPLDDDVNARLARHDGFFKAGKIIGYGAVQIGAAIGTWGIGRMVDKRGRAAHMGLDLLRAQIVTQSVTYALKYTVRRDRPDDTSGYAFPSGHASTTFATASVLERHFGWKAGVPTYILAIVRRDVTASRESPLPERRDLRRVGRNGGRARRHAARPVAFRDDADGGAWRLRRGNGESRLIAAAVEQGSLAPEGGRRRGPEFRAGESPAEAGRPAGPAHATIRQSRSRFRAVAASPTRRG